MTLRAVLDIPVNDSQFVRFSELYNKYQEQLARQPNIWKKVSKEHEALSTNFERMTSAMMAQSQLAREQAARERKEESHLTLADRLWTSMSHSTKSVAANITHATSALIKWSSILSGVSGLIGFGGLWGIDRMATAVSGERRTSMGLGMSIGELQAFRVNFQRLVEPDAFLGRLNEMETNPAKAWPLYAMGVAPSGNTERDAVSLMRAMRARALATPVNQLGLLDQQTGLEVGAATWRRLHNMSAAEFSGLIAGNARDVATFRTSPTTNEAWQNLSTQFGRAGTTLFDAFQTRLGQLSPELTTLSKAFTKLGLKLINSPLIEKGLKKLGHWLDDFSGKIKKPDFLKSIDRFIADAGALADGIHWLASEIKKLRHPGQVAHDLGSWAAGGMKNGFAEWWGSFANFLDTMPDRVHQSFTHPGAAFPHIANAGALLKGYPAFWGDYETLRTQGYQGPGALDRFNRVAGYLDLASGLPPGLLEYQKRVESGMHLAHVARGAAGEIGVMQLMPKTAAAYGVDATDPLESLEGAAAFDRDLMRKYHDNVRAVIAAYNMGEKEFDPIYRKHPQDFERYVPRRTREYVTGFGAPRVALDVHVTTTPGADVSVAASQLAQVPQ